MQSNIEHGRTNLFLTEFLLKYVDHFNGILKTINMSHRMSKISFLNLDILKVDR